MAWIELHQTLPTNKKTMRLSIILNIDAVQAVGHLCFLWLWAIDNAPDGNLSNFYNGEIALVAGWKGDPDDFVNALIKSGFVNENKSLHDWYDYAGKLIEKRRDDADRKRTAREKTEEIRKKSAGRPADIQRTSEINPCDGAGNSTVPNRTVPNQTYDVVVKGEKFINIDKDERTRAEIASAWGREPSPTEIRKAISLMENLGDEVNPESLKLLAIALRICVERSACNVAFLTGIYNNFRDRGIKTVADYYDYEQGGRHEG